MNEQRAFTPTPEQIAKWRKRFESRYDLSQLGTIYERYLDLAVREAWGNYVEAREDALTDQATTIVDDRRVAEAIKMLTDDEAFDVECNSYANTAKAIQKAFCAKNNINLSELDAVIAKDTQLTALGEMVKLSQEMGLYEPNIAGEAT